LGVGIVVLKFLTQTMVAKAWSSVRSTDDMVNKLGDDE